MTSDALLLCNPLFFFLERKYVAKKVCGQEVNIPSHNVTDELLTIHNFFDNMAKIKLTKEFNLKKKKK